MRARSTSSPQDHDLVLLRCGEELSSALIEVGAIPSPLTRTALLVFEDSLQDDHAVAEVLMHMQQLREGLGEVAPEKVCKFLEVMIDRLGDLPAEHTALMFRSGFLQRRGIVPA